MEKIQKDKNDARNTIPKHLFPKQKDIMALFLNL